MKSIRAIERASDVLLSFSRGEPTRDVAYLARSLRLSRATLYRILFTLEQKGLVRSFGDPLRYELSHGAGAIADAWSARTPVLAVCRPYLDELMIKTKETVALMVPVSLTTRVCLYEQRGSHVLAFSRGVGYTEPLFRGASGKAMLACFDEDRRTEVMRAVPTRERSRLLAELVRIKERGYASSVSELVPGAASIATAVFDSTGSVVASVCLFGAAARFETDVLSSYVRDLVATATLSSAAFGHRTAKIASENS